jgi:hypothetical protein
MNLQDFLYKWEPEAENRLTVLLTQWFQRDQRTMRNWRKSTPRPAQLALALLDRQWTEKGKSYTIFFDL